VAISSDGVLGQGTVQDIGEAARQIVDDIRKRRMTFEAGGFLLTCGNLLQPIAGDQPKTR